MRWPNLAYRMRARLRGGVPGLLPQPPLARRLTAARLMALKKSAARATPSS